jgi:hypothetical protein
MCPALFLRGSGKGAVLGTGDGTSRVFNLVLVVKRNEKGDPTGPPDNFNRENGTVLFVGAVPFVF